MQRFSHQDIRHLVAVEGLEHIEALRTAGRRFLLTAGHFGFSEIGSYRLGVELGRIRAVGRLLDNPYLNGILHKYRARFGLEVVSKKGAGLQLVDAQRNGVCGAMIIDQHVGRSAGGIRIDFLGHPSWTSPILAYVSIKTRSPVIHFTCIPMSADRYLLRIRPPIEPVSEGCGAERKLTARYLEYVEDDVRQHPKYWMWMHRRWRD